MNAEPDWLTFEARNRAAVQRNNPELFAAVSAAMFKHDPAGINFGTNADEYECEAATVIPRLAGCQSSDEVLDVLAEELNRWFTQKWEGERRGALRPLADELLALKAAHGVK